ncbi:hypothetical protein J1N35_031602 [Gossypium stocksii]|uniref:Uncharacterized protein n=1 Tax=Gossypium stocksii TaxID=47602 RepID=A0A9D3V1H1_9ROSI|nr:hypothetical protein J1N35_031602 [Gossypium stocksii]
MRDIQDRVLSSKEKLKRDRGKRKDKSKVAAGEDKVGLNRSVSDHILILLSYGSADLSPKPFKFFNAWVNKKESLSIISKVWGESAWKERRVSRKLKKLKGALKKWNGEKRFALEKSINEIEG